MSLKRSFPPSTSQWKYDVFLSFRGEDTRKAFTDNLYSALKKEGIITFRDDPELQKGEAIAPALFAAIDESRCAIIVLSQNYGSSTWCLEELVKILECMKASGRRVLPIFYDVDPSDVRKQTGSFREAFASHEERFRDDLEKVQRWRSALTEVASFSGWDSRDRYEGDLIRDIVKDILNKVQPPSLGYAENLVGMDSRLKPVFLHLGSGVDDVRFIGIWGMGGIGKTTMVRAVYERIYREFECRFLLTDIRDSVEKVGLLNLQKQLLSGIIQIEKAEHIFDLLGRATMLKRWLGRKKVLLILDDVNRLNHLKYLAGNPEWFGSGSRVLITTRNEHLLIQHGVERRLKVEELNYNDSLQLFSWKAFKKGYPEEDFLGLSKSVIRHAKGLPLALAVLGSSLYGRGLSAWKSALSQLGRVCNPDIFDVLKISYDDLDSDGKKIFLDIACFFNGENKVRVTEILNSCDVSAIIGIEVLMERSLLSHSNGRLWMHDLLIEMGHQIVHLESSNELGRCSRLWLSEDVKHVLTQNTGTEAIEGIYLDSTESGVEVDMNPKSFSMMRKLRYLKIKNGNLPKGLEYLPNSLRIFDWKRYPSKSLPPDFNPQKLFELRLRHSSIKHVRIGTEPLYNLKTVNLSHSLNLVSTPNLKYMPYLEVLLLEGCIRLYELDPGIQVLERLSLLNLKDCKNLVHFANSVRGLKSLKFLDLSGCSKLIKLPNDMGTLESLEELHVNGTSLKELPSSIGMLERLHLLEMEDCKDLVSLPVSVRGLKSLKIVNVSGCSKLEKFPDDLGHMECLVEVDACGTSIRELPCSIGILEGLVSMSLRDCKNLVCLPSSVGGLKSLKDLDLSGCLKLEKLPDELGHVACLENLDVSGSGISYVPSLKNLKVLSLAGCRGKSLRSRGKSLQSWIMMFNPFQLLQKNSRIPPGLLHCLSGLHSLTKLNLSDCNLSEEAIPSDFGCLTSLEDLNLSRNQFVRLPESIGQLPKLQYIYVDRCRKLQILPEFSSYPFIIGNDCISLDTLTTQTGQRDSLLQGEFVNCFKMVEKESCKSIALTLLARWLESKAFSDLRRRFDFVGLGNEIPEWYNHQSVGSSITVELHPGWFTEKVMGFALSVVFRFLKPLPPLVVENINCKIKAGQEIMHHPGMDFKEEWGQAASFHTWFCFLPCDEDGFCKWKDIYYQLRFSFGSYLRSGESGEKVAQVNKCGVRVVYEDDVKELWQTLSKQSNTKRGLQLSDCNDAASSSESQAHPKRFKLHLEGAGPSGSP